MALFFSEQITLHLSELNLLLILAHFSTFSFSVFTIFPLLVLCVNLHFITSNSFKKILKSISPNISAQGALTAYITRSQKLRT